MIAAGADVDVARSVDGWTPLLGGAWAGEEECVQILLDAGADINARFTLWDGNRQAVWELIEDRASQVAHGDSRQRVWELIAAHKSKLEKDGAGL